MTSPPAHCAGAGGGHGCGGRTAGGDHTSWGRASPLATGDGCGSSCRRAERERACYKNSGLVAGVAAKARCTRRAATLPQSPKSKEALEGVAYPASAAEYGSWRGRSACVASPTSPTMSVAASARPPRVQRPRLVDTFTTMPLQ
ncbi:uncharacterized protein LOC142588764 [Dermacentor variabilis]|uniref:uncharacterized protein LOC142588764 n=1 Tax=Dermacentor variabilis TaxID=34621 RepID=UPI003F5C40C2